MPRNRPHFDDLNRRYREIDWVSEIQRLWAIFNHWLTAHTGNHNDRDCVEHLKSTRELARWVDDIVRTSAGTRPHNVREGYGGSYPRFASNNELSRLFRAVAPSPVIEPRLNYPWRAGSDSRVRKTNAITLSDSQFRSAYEAHAELLATEEGMVFDLTLHQTLPALGVNATGCCFFRCKPQGSTGTTRLAHSLAQLFRHKDELQGLVNLIDSDDPTDLASDVIETLYNVRNVAVHGNLDFLNEKDNAAARAAYDALDSLIRDIRDRW